MMYFLTSERSLPLGEGKKKLQMQHRKPALSVSALYLPGWSREEAAGCCFLWC